MRVLERSVCLDKRQSHVDPPLQETDVVEDINKQAVVLLYRPHCMDAKSKYAVGDADVEV